MNKKLLLVPAVIAMALALPVQGHKTSGHVADDPDTLTVDTTYSVDPNWDGIDEAFSVDPNEGDSDEVNPEDFCTYDEALLSDFDNKSADYNLQNKKDADAGVSFNATLFTPSNDVKKESAYAQMTSRILTGMLDSADVAKWKVESLDKMLENKWKAIKSRYTTEQSEIEAAMGDEYRPQNYSFRTSITPVWRFSDKDCLTYSIEDEAYTGGAHGMLYHYFFTLNTKEDKLLGLTDIFKPEALPEVFKLVGEKLKTGPQAANDEETWPSVAEVLPAPTEMDYSVRTGQMEEYEGKWYPRPALTECGIVFTYPPYVKNCYAAGTIHILINYAEAKDWLK